MKNTVHLLLSASLILLGGGLLINSAKADTMTFNAENIASGVNGLPNYSLPAGQSDFGFGTQDAVVISSQLRFDVSALHGLYSSITSATLELTYDQYADAANTTNTVSVYQLTDANAVWNNTGTWATREASATDDNPWAGEAAGGDGGATVAGVDYVNTSLGSANYLGGAEGTTLDITLSGPELQAVLNSWATGGLNQGFVLLAPKVSGNSEATFELNPTLIVTYEAIPEPSVWVLMALGLGVFALARRNRRMAS